MKYCPKCKKEKSKNEFYKSSSRSDGVRGYCKLCSSLENRSLRKYYAKYNRNRYKNDENFRNIIKKRTRRFTKKKGDMIYVSVFNAIKKGMLLKKPCMICGNKKVHGHHKDYKKVLDVIWLCPLHHRRVHLQEIIV